MKTATIYTIAKKCGVSSATVSRALRRHPSVKPETADRINAMAATLGYRPSLAARSLVARDESAFSRMERPIFIPFNQTSNHPFADPLFFDYFYGMTDRLGAGPYRAELVRFKCASKEFETVRDLVDRKQIVGLVDFHCLKPTVEYLLSTDIPMVTMHQEYANLGISAVLADHVGGYRQAWRHAVELGHQRVGFFGDQASGRRYSVCQAGAAIEGALERLCVLIQCPDLDSSDEVWRQVKLVLGDYNRATWPTLFFAQNDFIACRFASLLQGHGIAVPEQVSVIGFDDSTSASCASPQLTTIRGPREEIGYEMVDYLVNVISGRARKRGFIQTLPTSLVIRESTAPAKVGTTRNRLSRAAKLNLSES